MPIKETYDLCFDGAVAGGATDIQTSGIIPEGKSVRILNFGGYDPLLSDGVSSIIAIQIGSTAGGWKTIRAGGNGFFDIKWDKGKEYIGDGQKRFRLIRQNKSTQSKNMTAWFFGIVIN